MNCKIHIFLLNEQYSQSFADEHHHGQASADNVQFEWEDELEISSSVSAVKEHQNATYPLMGFDENNEAFRYEIPSMRLFEIHSEDTESIFVGASESILSETKLHHDGDQFTVEIYLKDYEPMSNPIPGIFIASKAFPKELIRL